MPYTISKTNGSVLTIIEDGKIDTTTDLVFIGKNYTGYGDPVNENFVRLLENFSNVTPPSKPLTGQLWYDNNSNRLKIYSGSEFKSLAVISTGTSAPLRANYGDLHFNGSLFYAHSGRDWIPIGPFQSGNANNSAQLPVTSIIADDQSLNAAINITIGDGSTIILSTSSAYGVYSTNDIYTRYKAIYPGITLPDTNADGISGYYDSGSTLGNVLWGTAASAIGLVDYTNSVKRLVRISELVTKSDLVQGNTGATAIGVDDGITINNVFQLHVTRNQGIAAANISNIRNSIIKFNVKTDAGTYTNFINFDGTDGIFKVVPPSETPVNLGSDANRFSLGFINNLRSTDILTSLLTSTNIATTNLSVNTLTVTSNVVVTRGIALGSTSTINGARILTTATLFDNSQLSNGAGYLTAATVLNYGVASVRGTSGQINVSSTTGNVTFSFPSTVSIGTLNATVVSAPDIFMNGSRVLTAATFTGSGLTSVVGTANQIVASTLGTEVTLSLPSSIQVTTVNAGAVYDNGSRVLTQGSAVTSFSGGSTGLTPFGANVGNIILGGLLNVATGGTGAQTFTAGYVKASGTSPFTSVAKIPYTDVNGTPTKLSDFTNDLGFISQSFPAGTKLVFAQTAAPAGWTKVTTFNDAALRVVSGTSGGLSGGTTGFGTVFSTRSVTGTISTSTTGVTLDITNTEMIENEQNQFTVYRYAINDPGHGHSFTAPSLDFNVKYVDVIIASKD